MAPVAANGEPDLRGLGRVLWAKKAKILGFTLLAAAAAFAVVNAMTPRYRSESRLLLEARENVFLRAEADKNGGDRNTIDPEAVTSQIQLVLSRDLAREVIKKENSPTSRNSIRRLAARRGSNRCSACSASAAIRARCRRKSARSNPITTGSTSTRWKNPA